MNTEPVADTMSDDDENDLTGQVLSDRYRLLKRVAEGGMGVIYQAEHIHMRKTLAVKVLHPELTTVDEMVMRFEREAQAAANIDHPNVCAATDFGRAKSGAFFLVMEYLEGKPLSDVLKEEGSVSMRRALSIATQICSALARAHDLGIVHRDLKPENVLLVERDDEQDFVKVLDFGIARVPLMAEHEGDKNQTLTKAGFVMGTPAYISPEQGSGGEVDHRADLYSLGVVLFETIAGRRPFASPSTVELIGMHVTKPPPPLSRLAASVKIPRRLDQLVAKLLAKEPHQRPQSAAEVRVELKLIREGLDTSRSSDAVVVQVAKEAATRAAEGLITMRNRVSPVLREVREAAPDVVPLVKKMPRWLWAVLTANLLLCVLVAYGAGSSLIRDDTKLPVGPSDQGNETPEAPKTSKTPSKAESKASVSPLEKLRARADVAEVLAKRKLSGPKVVADELTALYEKEGSPELAYLLSEAEVMAGEHRTALNHAKAALIGNPKLSADPGMKAFILNELGSRNGALALSLIEEHYLPAATSDLAALACSAQRHPGRWRAQVVLQKMKATASLEPHCKLIVELERSKRCSTRKSVVNSLESLGDPRALPALEHLRTGGSGRGALRRRRANRCLTDDLEKAIKTLQSAAAKTKR